MALQEVFMTFAKFGEPQNAGQMTGKNFFKLCEDCKLLDKKAGIDKTRVDLIFAQVKPKGGNRISFDDFKNGLAQIAKTKGVDVQVVIDAVCKAGGPVSHATKADTTGVYDKLTDQTTYTGMYAERFKQ